MHTSNKTNIVLIGMPGSGKSTVGPLLARETNKSFLDTDALIEAQQQCSLQDIVDKRGYLALRTIESQCLLKLSVVNTVVATGGSVVYGEDAMRHLGNHGTIVFLRVELETVKQRITNYGSRGLAKAENQTLGELYDERLSLYTKFATVELHCDSLQPEVVSRQIARLLTD